MNDIDRSRIVAIDRHRGGRNFATAALAAALHGIGLKREDFTLGAMNPFGNLGRFPTLLEFNRHVSSAYGGGISITCRDDLEAMFGPLKRPRKRPGAATSLRFDQAQRRDRRRKRRNFVNYAKLRKERRTKVHVPLKMAQSWNNGLAFNIK